MSKNTLPEKEKEKEKAKPKSFLETAMPMDLKGPSDFSMRIDEILYEDAVGSHDGPGDEDEFLAEEEELVAQGLMRLPLEEKNNDFMKNPLPRVSDEAARRAIRAERDED
jgi:hypothetical protein